MLLTCFDIHLMRDFFYLCLTSEVLLLIDEMSHLVLAQCGSLECRGPLVCQLLMLRPRCLFEAVDCPEMLDTNTDFTKIISIVSTTNWLACSRKRRMLEERDCRR